MGEDWTDSEFGWEEVRSELARIRRRVRSRWLLTALVALLLTALVVARQSRKEKTHRATVMLRVTEGSFDPTTSPPTSAELQQYLWEVAFTRSRLLEVMNKHNLYVGLRNIDPLLAFDEMRGQLDVDVLRNDFRVERDPDAPPRSARIALNYSHPDPETALEVARTLSNAMAEQESATRRRTTEIALESMRTSEEGLESEIARVRAEEAHLASEMQTGDPSRFAAYNVRLRSVMRRIESLENEERLTSQAVSHLGFRTNVEGKELGLRFEIIDPGSEPRVMLSNQARLGILGLLTFLVMLPIAGVGVAAYDLRVYDAYDLKRLGFDAFGHVPAFKGYRQGTYNDRLRKRKGAS